MGDENPYTKLPMTSSRESPKSKNLFASMRAKLLFGCYRRGDANDAETYVAAITLVLAQYPDNLIAEVTDPRSGIQTCEKFAAFMPNAGELKVYCEQVASSPRYKAAAASETSEFAGRTFQGRPVDELTWMGVPLTPRQKQQLLDREAYDNSIRSDPTRPTYEELKRRYGRNFGVGKDVTETPEQINARWATQTKSWDEIKQFYEKNPDRWNNLIKPREAGLK
jgi:hypothetical protein